MDGAEKPKSSRRLKNVDLAQLQFRERFTIDEVAGLLNGTNEGKPINKRKVETAIANGELRIVRDGYRVYVTRAQLDEYTRTLEQRSGWVRPR